MAMATAIPVVAISPLDEVRMTGIAEVRLWRVKPSESRLRNYSLSAHVNNPNSSQTISALPFRPWPLALR